MKAGKVNEIILPYKKGLPLDPSLAADDRITDAVKVMLEYEIEEIVVMRNIRPIGRVRISDALKKLGINLPGYR